MDRRLRQLQQKLEELGAAVAEQPHDPTEPKHVHRTRDGGANGGPEPGSSEALPSREAVGG